MQAGSTAIQAASSCPATPPAAISPLRCSAPTGLRVGAPADLVKGGTAISGIFDLAPLMETSINDDVRLDAEAAARNSPIHNLPSAGAGGLLIAAVGAAETPAFIAQNRAFAEAWQAHGFEATVMEIEDLHHFNVVMEMGRPGSALTQAALAQMGL